MTTPSGQFDRGLSALLALAAAYVDTCGFIGLFGLFTAHVTGNFLLVGAELVAHHSDVLAKLSALPVFLVSVVMTAQAEVTLQKRGYKATSVLLLVQAGLLAMAAVAFYSVGSPVHPDDKPVMAIGFLLIAAMGVQNALMRTSLAGPVQTTVMTGNVAQIAIDLLSLASGRADATVRGRITKCWPAIAGFALGSVMGASLYAWLNFHCLWLAAVLVGFAAVASRKSPAQN